MNMIVSSAPAPFVLGCADREANIRQNLRVILSTLAGEIPLHRDCWISPAIIDKPYNLALPLVVVTLKNAIEQGEPRVEFIRANYYEDTENPGHIIYEVEVKVKNE